MHYWRRNNALQNLGVLRLRPGGHYFFTNNALAGILIFLETGHVKKVIVKVSEEEHIWLLVTSQ